MVRRLLEPDAENGTRSELKEAGRVGSNETALRCTAGRMLLTGISATATISNAVMRRSFGSSIKAASP